jgi:hypothetical protein
VRFLARACVSVVACCLFFSTIAASAPAQTADCASAFDDVGNPCPDLQIAGDIEAAVDGSTVTFLVPVVNAGSAESSETEVVASATELETAGTAVGSLGPEESETVTIATQFPDEVRGESIEVSFTVDPSNVVQEENERNNSASLGVLFPLEETPTTTTTTTTETQPTTTETVTQPTTRDPPTTETGEDGVSNWLLWAAVAGGAVLLAAAAASFFLRGRRTVGEVMAEPPERWEEEPRPPPPPEPYWPQAEPPPAEPYSPEAEPPEPWPPPEGAASAPPVEPDTAGVEPAPVSPSPGADEAPRRPSRLVNTGFSDAADPGSPLSSTTPLRPGGDYFFWLEVGELVAQSIEETPVELSEADTLAPGSRLTVVVFPVGETSSSVAFPEGELYLAGDGSVAVSSQPSTVAQAIEDRELLARRLFFPVDAPGEEGTLLLRCSIFHKQILLQSRLVTARVSDVEESIQDALRSTLDFTLAPRLDPEHLGRLPEYRLSLLLNQTEDGTHSLTVKGATFSDAASFDSVELEGLLQQCRRSLRKAAWQSEDPWQAGFAYRYQQPTPGNLVADLVTLAIWGKRFYVKVSDRLAGQRSRRELADDLRTPGFVQLALKQSPRHLLPAALFYDHKGLVDTADIREYRLCEGFLTALDGDAPLQDTPCFQGECPSRESTTTVCPSGFWGYRHALGIPFTLKGAPDVPLSIEYSGQPSMAVAVSTDPEFELRVAHEGVLREIRPDLLYAATRADALAELKRGRAHVVYFYCHGGRAKDVPYISVGPLTEEFITAVTLHNEDILWEKPRPLVFLNGCHTTGLEPEQAFEFVSAFVTGAHAAGVIGTEITVFEPLARAFAEDCLRRFLGGAELGWAVRDARLALLKASNPLGLVYLPYALPSLRLVPTKP